MAERMRSGGDRLSILLSPWMILAGIGLGIIVGFTSKGLAAELAPFGDIYLGLLQMCILPIMMTAIVSSLGHLLTTRYAGRYLKRLIFIFVAGLALAAVVGIAFGVVFQPGKGIAKSGQVAMGKTIYEAEAHADKPIESSSGIIHFLRAMVPTNIFRAISQGENLAVLFFSILVGVALGLVRSAAVDTTLSVMDSLYDAFLKIIGWMMYGLPFGLCCLLAEQVSKVGAGMMLAMLKLIVLFYICAFMLLIGYSIIIWSRVGGSYVRSFMALKETLMVSLGTSSSFASIPSALRGLHQELKLEKQTADLVIPLGVSLHPQGSVVHFAMASLFISQLYGAPLGIKEAGLVLFGSVFAGLAASGAPGLAGLSMISLVMDPLGLPSKVAVILLASIDPIVDPILTAVNVYGNCAATALVAKRTQGPESETDS